MTQHDHADVHRRSGSSSFWPSRNGFALLVFFIIAGIFLSTEHRAHLLGALLWLLLLACPLMHLFMHGSHGGSGEGGDA